MRNKHRNASFTLIELLIVIGILAILASLLLPSLMRAKYLAREVVCMNNIKQQAIGVLSYTVDNDGYYPGLRLIGHDRADSHMARLAWPHVNILNSQLADYWGADAVSFENEGTITDDPLNLKPNIWKPDDRYIDTNYLQYYGMQEYLLKTNEYVGQAMLKVDSYYISKFNTGHPRPKVKVLISDVMNRWYDHPGRRSFVNHTNLDPDWITPTTDMGWIKWTHRTPAFSPHPRMSGHFGAQDGSVRKYMIPAIVYDGFVKYRAFYQVIPEELTEEK